MQATQHFHKPYTDDWDEPQPDPKEFLEIEQPGTPAMPGPPSLPTPAQPVAAVASTTPAVAPTPIPASHMLDRFPGIANRTALFGVGRFDERVTGAREIACYETGMEIELKGPALTLMDKRVWEVALSAAKAFGGAGVDFKLPANRIAKKVRDTLKPGEKPPRKPGGKLTSAIGASLRRLAKAEIAYKTPEGGAGCAKLLGSAVKAESGWRVSISPGLLPALRDHKQFQIDVARRRRLSTDIARWLHDFLSTHQKEYSVKMKVEELARLCGVRTDLSHFPSNLEKALIDVKAICPELLASYALDKSEKERTSWWITMVKGAENATFVWPAEEERRAQAKRDATERKKAAKGRRAGPSL